MAVLRPRKHRRMLLMFLRPFINIKLVFFVFFLTQVSRVGHRYGRAPYSARRKIIQEERKDETTVDKPHTLLMMKCCFTSTENVRLLGTGAQDKWQSILKITSDIEDIKNQRTERTSTSTFTQLLSFDTLLNTCLVLSVNLLNTCLVLSVNHHVPSSAFCARHVWSVSCVPRRCGEVTRGDPKMASRPHKYWVWERVEIRFVRFFCSTEQQRQKFSSMINSKKLYIYI